MNKNLIATIITILVVGAFAGVFIFSENSAQNYDPEVSEQGINEEDSGNTKNSGHEASAPDLEVVAENLSIPWEIAFLPDGEMLVTQRTGSLLFFENDTPKTIPIPGAEHSGEGGLLGVAIHPQFESNNFVYLYMTTRSGNGLTNRVVRYVFKDGELTNPLTIVENIPGSQIHDGGRIAFGPPTSCESGQAGCHLYVTTGDASNPALAQDINSLAGKILRLNDDGTIPQDNPFGNAVWSYGHRNPQGITWDGQGRLWSTEHGPSARDELNLISRGENYGWPDSVGDVVQPGTIAPMIHSGENTWAPASALYWDGSIFFGGLRGSALYEAVLSGGVVSEIKRHYSNEFGRIRTVVLGPDGMFYITTSNRDGRGTPMAGDDKIVKVNPQQFR